VGAKFSPTWKIGRDADQHIRWDVAPLGKWVRREVPHACSSSSLARHDARASRFAELSLGAELIFLLHRKPECLTESFAILYGERDGRAGLRNHSSLQSYTGEGELGFWQELCATAWVLHRGSSSFQVGRCCLAPSSSSSASTVFSNVVINNVTAATSPANERYMQRTLLFVQKRKLCLPCSSHGRGLPTHDSTFLSPQKGKLNFSN
jgi:hypothetical protein